MTFPFTESYLPEEELLNHLQNKTFHPLVRPVKNQRDAVDVKLIMMIMGLSLVRLTFFLNFKFYVLPVTSCSAA